MILIISTPKDAHIPFVARHLAAPPVIIDTTSIKDKAGLTFSITDKHNRVFYKGEELTNVTGVWFRRVTTQSRYLHLPVEAHDEAYCATALGTHASQLFGQFPNAVWISEPNLIERANKKTFQLKLATEEGFTIPDTIFTSDSDEARRFVAKHGMVIAKPQAKVLPAKGKLLYQFFSSKITAADNIRYEGLHLAPTIFQEAIQHVSDIRVTVVGKEVFAAKIVETEPQAGKIRDWRVNLNGSKLEYSAFELPPKLTKACVALVQRLGLKFGAIDLVEDAAGQLFFLEINPNGQWAFIEEETGQPIGKALAALLEQR
jgi:glutathione synthase/RimK-type ligase-like ATP-grasp enzyme